jgi:hypothetical protein
VGLEKPPLISNYLRKSLLLIDSASVSKFRETRKMRNKAKINEKDAKQNSKLARLSETKGNNAKLPHFPFVLFSLASLEFCFASYSFSFALFRIFSVSRNLATLDTAQLGTWKFASRLSFASKEFAFCIPYRTREAASDFQLSA